MSYYRVKDEYWNLWGDSADPVDYIMDLEELWERLDDWGLDWDDVFYQLEVLNYD